MVRRADLEQGLAVTVGELIQDGASSGVGQRDEQIGHAQ
jgi:hypothetical protein